MRNRFDNELEKLDKQLIEMGSLIEEAIKLASNALIKNDLNLANDALNLEKEIDAKERDIEAFCFKLIVEQQPVASDLRSISTALKIITDMERIGDHAEDISEITIHLIKTLDQQLNAKILKDLTKMAEATIEMVNKSIDSFVNKDLEGAYAVIKYDDTVDNLFDVIKNDLIDYIAENKDNGSSIIDFLMISKYFERIGDHAQNIAEWVVYRITGEHKTS